MTSLASVMFFHLCKCGVFLGISGFCVGLWASSVSLVEGKFEGSWRKWGPMSWSSCGLWVCFLSRGLPLALRTHEAQETEVTEPPHLSPPRPPPPPCLRASGRLRRGVLKWKFSSLHFVKEFRHFLGDKRKGLAGEGWRPLKRAQKVLQKCVPILLRGHRKKGTEKRPKSLGFEGFLRANPLSANPFSKLLKESAKIG